MSGGFFRGTSADQDTRFSNKQAKLLKSQKFAPELEHLVDMAKVNMEVIKPWITRRVTELLGFEDEVLINFIHSLLDAKEVNGKEVQIQITGFMEKNTGKFMKELWTLLLSAQKNASGVPQQFLDAKEEELRKKKVENDRITTEIQKKKHREGIEVMQQRLKKMEGGFDSKDPDAASHPALKSGHSGDYVLEKKDADKQNGVRAANRVFRSPHSPTVSTSHRDSPSGSMSKSFSNSQSYSGDRHRPRSISRSPKAQGRSPRRGSPWRSPFPRRRPSYSRQRSRSRSHYRSPSPVQRRVHSPFHHRSPPLHRRRSPSPMRRRRSPSPMRRRRSPSPVRRRRSPSPLRRHRSPSPIRRGSPSPARRRSPITWHRSPLPVRQMSPVPRKCRSSSPMQSPSPVRQRYRSRTPQHRFPSPLRHRSPVNRRLPSLSTQRSPSPNEWSSQSPVQHSSPSQDGRKTPRHRRSPVLLSREKARMQERSPEARQTFSPSRSLQRDKHRNSLRHQSEYSHSTPEKSLIALAAPRARNSVSSQDRRSSSPYGSPRRQRGVKLTSERSSNFSKQRGHVHDNSETREGTEEMCHSRENRDSKTKSLRNESKYSSPDSRQKDLPAKNLTKDEISPKRAAGHMSSESHGRYDKTDLRKKGQEVKSEKSSGRGGHPETLAQQKSPSERTCESYAVDSKKSDENNQIHLNHVRDGDQRCKSDGAQDSLGKFDRVNPRVSYDSGSEESDKHRREDKDRRKHKRSERKVVSSDEEYSYDSELEKRKESKRRKKEERKQRKEERRQRRAERRRKREERRAEKLKIKGKADYSSSDDNGTERMRSQQSDEKD